MVIGAIRVVGCFPSTDAFWPDWNSEGLPVSQCTLDTRLMRFGKTLPTGSSTGSGRYVESSEMSSRPIGLRWPDLMASSGKRESKREDDFQFSMTVLLLMMLLVELPSVPAAVPLFLSFSFDDAEAFGKVKGGGGAEVDAARRSQRIR